MSAEPYEGAERDPFALTTGADDYVPSAAIERAFGEAMAALSAGRVPVISGPTGLGKTLLLHLLARACAGRCQPLYVPYCSLAPEELASLVLGLLDWSRGADPEIALLDAARQEAERGRRLLLLVDDAASLPGETAAQLAHWLNASGGALQVALAGLPGASLRHARDAFGDRAEEVVLGAGLRSEEIRPYVEVRLAAARAEPAIRAAFDARALAELERVSGGNPRRLNLAAQAIVRNAYGADAQPTSVAGRPATPIWQDLAGVGEYRFVRGHFVDPHSGGTLPTPPPESVWREELRGTQRERARAARPIAEPELEIDAGLGAELELDADVRAGAADALAPEAGDSAFAPRLEPEPLAPRSRSRHWRIAAGVGGLAFAIGAWTQLRPGAPPLDVAIVMPPPARVAPAPLPALPLPAPQIAPAASPPQATEGVASPPQATEGVASPPESAVPEAIALEPVGPPSPELGQQEAVAEVERASQAEPPSVAESAPPAFAATAELAGEAGSPPAETVAEVASPPAETAPEVVSPPAESVPEVVSPPAETVPVAINATPWAVIEIDGEEVGETPLAGIQLTTGRHRFRARMPDGTVRERVVRIDANTPTVVFE